MMSFQKILYLIGAVLIGLGNLVPWWCAGHWDFHCVSGLNIAISLPNINSNTLFLVFLGATIIGLLISSLNFATQSLKWTILSIATLFCIYFFLDGRLYVADNWAFLIVPLSAIVFYLLLFRPSFIKPLTSSIFFGAISLTIISTLYFVSLVLQVIAENNVIGDTISDYGQLIVSFGLPMLIIGSLIVFFVALREFRGDFLQNTGVWNNKVIQSRM